MSALLTGTAAALVLIGAVTHDARRTTHDARRTTHDDPPIARSSPDSRPAAAPFALDARAVEEHFRTVPHVRARKGANVRFLKNGKAMIVEPCGGLTGSSSIKGHTVGCDHDHGASEATSADGESIHWFCAESQGSCLGGGASCPFAPYNVSAPAPTGFPNPNTKSAVYAGPRARYWPTPTVDFYVHCPQGEANIDARPNGPLQEDVFPVAAFGPFSPLGGGLNYHTNLCPGEYYYRYSEFIDDVCFTMAKYGAVADTAIHPALPPAGYVINGGSQMLVPHRCRPATMPSTLGSPYASVTAVFKGISGPAFPPYPVGTTPPVPNIVDIVTRHYGPDPFAGTTPTSFNCLFDNPIQALGGQQLWEASQSFTSSPSPCAGLGGPTGDEINEIIWIDSSVLIGPYDGLTSCLVDVATGQIQECDVLFFKRPSNQLGWPTYSCAAPPSASGCANGVGPGATTVYGHELGHFFGLDHTNLHRGTGLTGGPNSGTLPGLNNSPTGVGAPASLATYTTAVGSTTSASFSAMPDMVSLITSTNEWRCDPLRPVHPDEQAAIAELYGIAAVSTVTTATPVTFSRRPIINDFARWEGAARVLLPAPTFPDEEDALQPTAVFGFNVFPMLAGSTPGTFPCVGKVSGTAALSPNDVVGRRDTRTNAATAGRFRMEGIVVGQGGTDLVLCAEPLQSLFSIGNLALSPVPFAEWWQFPGYGNAALNRIWNVGLDGSVQLKLVSRRAHIASSLGTLYAFPSTVLEVDMDLSAPGTPLLTSTESVTRPTISIAPRDATLLSSGATLTATVYHDYQLDFSTARWEVAGGGTIPAGTPTTTTQPPLPLPSGATGPWITTYNRLVSGVQTGAGSDTVRFICIELPFASGAPSYRPPVGIIPVRGVNEVRF